MSLELSLSNFERQQQLVRVIQQQKRVSIAQICQMFSISGATARRDLETLAKGGKIRRIHGGAIPLQSAPPEPPLSLRSIDQAEEKSWIGQAAAALIADGETVFLGSGTTVLEVAQHLRD